jgi:hypothetical protein
MGHEQPLDVGAATSPRWIAVAQIVNDAVYVLVQREDEPQLEPYSCDDSGAEAAPGHKVASLSQASAWLTEQGWSVGRWYRVKTNTFDLSSRSRRWMVVHRDHG